MARERAKKVDGRSAMERKIRRAQRRLWANRWLRMAGWSGLIAASAWALMFLIWRLTGLELRLGIVAASLAGATVVAGTIAAVIRREDRLTAAVTLDKNAGLKERLSSGVYCTDQSDAFSQVVVDDANKTAATVRVGQAVPLEWPRPASWLAVPAALAVIVFFLPQQDLLGMQEKPDGKKDRLAAQTTKRKQLMTTYTSLKKRVEKRKELKDLKEKLEEAAQLKDAEELDPDAEQRKHMKGLQALKKTVQDKKEGEQYQANDAMKDLLSQLQQPEGKTPSQRLQSALAKGKFEEAAKIVNEMKDKIAEKEGSDGAKDAQLKEMEATLGKLSRQLKALSKTSKAEKQLAKVGLSKKQIEQLKKLLEEGKLQKAQQMLANQAKNLSQKEIQKLAKDMKKQMQGCKQCQGLGQKLGQAAAAMAAAQAGGGKGQLANASDALGQAAQQLSQSEMLSQSLKEMEGMLAELDEASKQMGSSSCSQCKGTGMSNGGKCSACGGSGVGGMQSAGSGGGMGGPGRGRGGNVTKKDAKHAFKERRVGVWTKAGDSIGSYLVDGVQVKGSRQAELSDAVQSARQDAEDSIDDDQFPKRYQSSVKQYFRDVAKTMEGKSGEAEKPLESGGAGEL